MADHSIKTPMARYGGTNAALTELADAKAKTTFVDTYEASEEEALGLVIAHHFEWDGCAIMRVFQAALEDANFHTEAAVVQEWLDQ